MGKELDTTITCRRCGKVFTFNDSEQQFYQQKGFSLPTHCKECRAIRHSQNIQLCSKCGKKLESAADIFCIECLETARLETIFETRALKESLDEARNKLNARESENTQMIATMKTNREASESEKLQLTSEFSIKLNNIESEKVNLNSLLEQEKQITRELEEKLSQTRSELEKELKNRAVLSSLEPTLNSINSILMVISRTQETMSNTLTQLTNSRDEKKQYPNILEVLRKIFGIERKSASPVK